MSTVIASNNYVLLSRAISSQSWLQTHKHTHRDKTSDRVKNIMPFGIIMTQHYITIMYSLVTTCSKSSSSMFNFSKCLNAYLVDKSILMCKKDTLLGTMTTLFSLFQSYDCTNYKQDYRVDVQEGDMFGFISYNSDQPVLHFEHDRYSNIQTYCQ